MLTEERIKQLALKATRCFRDPTVPTTITEDAIRLAIAETAEACARLADERAKKYRNTNTQLDYRGDSSVADAVAADIRAAAKGAK